MKIGKDRASKNIRITEEVYNLLMSLKKKDESFPELLLRLLKNQRKK
ncbi:MAG: hypothetical protein GF308_03120 [Candidatus Heimdallarchaeota archaeon]|nr:hypothetical protein [Candidatus Heimdallarchaeota archaeon]